jgi:hypothetical protein
LSSIYSAVVAADARWPKKCSVARPPETPEDRHWYVTDRIYFYVATRNISQLRSHLQANSLKGAKRQPVAYLAVAAAPGRRRFGDPIDLQKEDEIQRIRGEETVKILLDAGADPDIGYPLMAASRAGQRMPGYGHRIV